MRFGGRISGKNCTHRLFMQRSGLHISCLISIAHHRHSAPFYYQGTMSRLKSYLRGTRLDVSGSEEEQLARVQEWGTPYAVSQA